MTKAMYSGNATPVHPQRSQLRLRANDLQAGTVDAQGLEEVWWGGGATGQLVSVPLVELNKHHKTMGEDTSNDTSYIQLDIDELSMTASLHDLAKLFFISASWKGSTQPHPHASFCPLPSLTTAASLGHLHALLRHATLTQSSEECHSLLSLVVGEGSGGIVKESSGEGRGACVVPVLHGPLDTQQWNTADVYSWSHVRRSSNPAGHDRLVELFLARPAQQCEGTLYTDA